MTAWWSVNKIKTSLPDWSFSLLLKNSYTLFIQPNYWSVEKWVWLSTFTYDVLVLDRDASVTKVRDPYLVCLWRNMS